MTDIETLEDGNELMNTLANSNTGNRLNPNGIEGSLPKCPQLYQNPK
jgi:hypothetical protein